MNEKKFPRFYAFIKYLNGQTAVTFRSGDCQVRCPCAVNDFHDNNLKMYCNPKRQGDCEATFGENNTQIYMTQCSFLVLGGPIDSGSCPSVKSTFQFRNVLKIPSTTLHESSSFLVSFSDEFNSVTNMILCLFLVYRLQVSQ